MILQIEWRFEARGHLVADGSPAVRERDLEKCAENDCWLWGQDLFETRQLRFGHEVVARKEFDTALMSLFCL